MAAQEASESDNSGSRARSRGWCFTINDYSFEDLATIESLGCQYMVYGKETAPTTGMQHIQGYVYFTTLKSFKQVKQVFPKRTHLEAAKGSAEQNKEYCTKEDPSFHERGMMPAKPQSGGKLKNQERWDNALAAAQEGRVADIPSDIQMRYHGTIKRLREERLLVEGACPETDAVMEWFFGPAGSGKSRKARSENPGCYLKMCNKWWDGYKGEEVVLIEDFDLSHKVLCHHLKIWADRYSFRAEVKGGSMEIRPKKIIVTSNWHPENIWEDARDLEPILRRFKLTEFTGAAVAPGPRDGSGGGGLASTFHLP